MGAGTPEAGVKELFRFRPDDVNVSADGRAEGDGE
jgi:hypothetical protein